MIEVEKRAFLDKDEHQRILDFFLQVSKVEKDERQITTYYDCDADLRLMVTNTSHAQLWLKKGEMHDSYREEFVVRYNKDDYDCFRKILDILNYNISIKWYRSRKVFKWKDVVVTIDYSVGYGYIIEIEMEVERKSEISKAEEYIDSIFRSLNVNITPKQQFKEKFKDYAFNWKKYTEDISDDEFLNSTTTI